MRSVTSIFAIIVALWATVATQDTEVEKLENRTIVQNNGCLYPNHSPLPRDDYELHFGLGSYKLHTEAMAWNDARHTCEEEGAYLAIINSNAEGTALHQLYQKVGKSAILRSSSQEFIYIGFHDLYHEGDFVTIHGDSIYKAGYSNWAAGQPDNYNNNENCGTIYVQGGLNDMPCDAKLGFICELKT